ncbi:polysaccharide deacetylase family protein [Halostella salina]|uniref:polysaccharide deacetylase family protein n=1 Tax=Halostella salina TaxID=1547897 RepID=UPI000EF824FA|nr:polysaccharide deacetylase family protein [Halostella salina]
MSEASKLAVSVDVEDWYHVPTVSGAPFSPYPSASEFLDSWDGKYDYLTSPTKRTLDLFDELGITATFFVVADIVENYPGLVEEIASRGHEIGCHGLHHEFAIHPDTKEPRFTEDEYRDRLIRAKSILESTSGQDVTGFRAPAVYVAGWMLDIVEDLGFEYDSSVARNSLYNKTDQSLGDVGRTPYVPENGTLSPGGSRDLVELPWPYFRFPGARVPTAGGPLIRIFGRRILERGIKQSLGKGHSVFYFHPLDIARGSFPDVGSVNRRPVFWLFKGATAENRIRKLLRSIPHDQRPCRHVADSAFGP